MFQNGEIPYSEANRSRKEKHQPERHERHKDFYKLLKSRMIEEKFRRAKRNQNVVISYTNCRV